VKLEDESELNNLNKRMTSLTANIFAQFLWSHQELLLTEPDDISDFSKDLTDNLLKYRQENNKKPSDSSDQISLSINPENFKFKYHYTFWSDVTKVQEAGIKNSDNWEARLKEYGIPITDVSVCNLSSYSY
jgi:hypothetical protein